MIALAVGSHLAARTPGQPDLGAERLRCADTPVESGSTQPQMVPQGDWPLGVGPSVQVFVAGAPINHLTATPAGLNGLTVQESAITLHATNPPSASQNLSDNVDRLKDYALRCVQREAGMLAVFRF